MFTGIIEAVGVVKAFSKAGDSARVEAAFPNASLKTGESIAVNGVCLTITSPTAGGFCADIGAETLKVTTLGELKSGDYVNIERPLQMGDRLGGHLVQGHVDGVGKILNINKFDKGFEVTLEAPQGLLRYIIKRGSVAVNGVSLTAADCGEGSFKVFLIPHTIEATTFKYAKAGDRVNLEVDIIGRYVERLSGSPRPERPSRVTEDFLKEHGF